MSRRGTTEGKGRIGKKFSLIFRLFHTIISRGTKIEVIHSASLTLILLISIGKETGPKNKEGPQKAPEKQKPQEQQKAPGKQKPQGQQKSPK